MSLSLHVRGVVVFCCLAAASCTLVKADSTYVPEAGEYAPAGSLQGDQIHPHASINKTGGFMVWDDNFTDGDGQGVSALRLNGNLSGVYSSFRVNQQAAGDQENARVGVLPGGGAAFVWQGGTSGFQHIFARFLSASNTWTTPDDVQVSDFSGGFQIDPDLAVLSNGTAVVVWGSFNQADSGSMQDVYAQLLSPAGEKIGSSFLINQFTTYNQRTPVVAALSDGRFVVAWVSEQQRSVGQPNGVLGQPGTFQFASVDVYARLFDSSGTAVGGEFLVNTASNVCANPSITAGANGEFAIAWSEKDTASATTNSWDVFVRPFSNTGAGGVTHRVNTWTYGDQFAPQLAYAAGGYLEIWGSFGQDGSGKGVYGQFLQADGSPLGNEFRVNSSTFSEQMQAVVASDGAGRFLAVWSSFVGGAASFDLKAQRYVAAQQALVPAPTPFVTVLNATNLSLTWPALNGYDVANYEVYADGALTATATTTNIWWTMTGLTPGSTHSFRLAYVLADGRRSPLSGTASNTTYSAASYGGVPVDWMVQYYPYGTAWPAANAPLVPGGPTLAYVFLTGGNPLDPSTWLRTQLQPTSKGLFLSWNSRPGQVYQVQTAPSATGPWTNVDGPRYAAGTVDSKYVGGGEAAFYQVVLLR